MPGPKSGRKKAEGWSITKKAEVFLLEGNNVLKKERAMSTNRIISISENDHGQIQTVKSVITNVQNSDAALADALYILDESSGLWCPRPIVRVLETKLRQENVLVEIENKKGVLSGFDTFEHLGSRTQTRDVAMAKAVFTQDINTKSWLKSHLHGLTSKIIPIY